MGREDWTDGGGSIFLWKSENIRRRGNAVHKPRGLVAFTLHLIPYGEDDTVGARVTHENNYGLDFGDVQ